MDFRSNGDEVGVGVPGGSEKEPAEVEGSWEWTFAKVIKILAAVMLMAFVGILAFAWFVYRFIAG